MKKLLQRAIEAVEALDADDDPREPLYDTVQLGLTLILVLVAIGALYWMLWTVLVYEGGLLAKIGPALQVLLRRKTLADYGWRGPWDRGVFEGWLGNVVALACCSLTVAALHRLYLGAARRRR